MKKIWKKTGRIVLVGALACAVLWSGIRHKTGDYIDRMEKKYDPVGAEVVLIENGQITEVRDYGYADKEKKIKTDENTRFRIASISKTMTAYAVMQLVDEGKLDLDVPVNQYLKQWKIPDGTYDGDQVTLRMLMSHTAGLSGCADAVNEDEHGLLAAEKLTQADVHIKTKPGSSFAYSEFAGYGICQLVIEDVTGEKFEDYMQKEIFKPLGMDHTSYEKTGAMAVPYAGKGKPIACNDVVLSGAGGVITTATDLTKFDIALMDYARRGNGEMFLAQKNTESEAGVYGLGIIPRKLKDGRTVYEHNGTLTGWNAQLVLEPESRSGITIVTNSDKAFYFTYDLMEAWADHTLGEPVADPLLKKLERMILYAIIVGGILDFCVGITLFHGIKKKRLMERKSAAGKVTGGLLSAFYCVAAYLLFYTDLPFRICFGMADNYLFTFFTPAFAIVLVEGFVMILLLAFRMNQRKVKEKGKCAEYAKSTGGR